MSADGQAIERDIAAAIADVLSRHEGGFVTRWLALVESVDPDGDRGLWSFTSDDLHAWETVGMLQHGLHLQQAQALRKAAED